MRNSQRGRGVAEAEEQGWEVAEKREGNPETRVVAACCDVTPECREAAEAWEPAPILREDAEVCDVTTFYFQTLQSKNYWHSYSGLKTKESSNMKRLKNSFNHELMCENTQNH